MEQRGSCGDIHELKELVRQFISSMAGQNGYPRWMDIKTACRYTSMSKNTLMEYIKEGSIYARRLGGKWYVDRESIDNFMLQDPVKIHLAKLRFVR
jgi:excisionase family DNA binding protein